MNESDLCDYGANDAILQLRFDVIICLYSESLMFLTAACSFTSEKAGYEPTFGGASASVPYFLYYQT